MPFINFRTNRSTLIEYNPAAAIEAPTASPPDQTAIYQEKCILKETDRVLKVLDYTGLSELFGTIRQHTNMEQTYICDAPPDEQYWRTDSVVRHGQSGNIPNCAAKIVWEVLSPGTVIANGTAQKLLLVQDDIFSIWGDRVLSAAISSGMPWCVVIDTRTTGGRILADARCNGHSLGEYMQVVDLNPAPDANFNSQNNIRSFENAAAIDFEYPTPADRQMICNISLVAQQTMDMIFFQALTGEEEVRNLGSSIDNSDADMAFIENLISDKERRNYHDSEIKELIDLFVERIKTGGWQYEYTPPTETVDIVSAFQITTQEHLNEVNEYQELRGLYRIGDRIVVNDNTPAHTAKALQEIYGVDLAHPPARRSTHAFTLSPIVNPVLIPLPITESDRSAITALQDEIRTQAKTVDKATSGPWPGASQARVTAHTLHRNAILTNDGHYAVHNSMYDRNLFLKILNACKEGDQTKFSRFMGEFHAGWPPGKWLEQAQQGFLEAFSHLFVTGKFPSEGIRDSYYHFVLNCGQMW